MAVETWNLSRAHELTSFYNEYVRGIPHFYPVEPEEYQQGVRWSQQPQWLDMDAERLLVVRETGGVLAFAHVGTIVPRAPEQARRGLIRFLLYAPGHRTAGQAVLQAAEGHLAAAGLRYVLAFDLHHGYEFYHFGRGMLVDALTHVHGLFGASGYRLEETQVHMAIEALEPRAPERPAWAADADLEIAPSSWDPPGLSIRLLRDGEELARANGRPAGQSHRHEAARDQYIVGGINVAEPVQGQGLGRYLLRILHTAAYEHGYRRAVIGTHTDNWRAMLLYANEGYRIVCQEATYEKVLTGGF